VVAARTTELEQQGRGSGRSAPGAPSGVPLCHINSSSRCRPWHLQLLLPSQSTTSASRACGRARRRVIELCGPGAWGDGSARRTSTSRPLPHLCTLMPVQPARLPVLQDDEDEAEQQQQQQQAAMTKPSRDMSPTPGGTYRSSSHSAAASAGRSD